MDSSAIRKAIEVVYAAYLPKHTHPFLYIRYFSREVGFLTYVSFVRESSGTELSLDTYVEKFGRNFKPTDIL